MSEPVPHLSYDLRSPAGPALPLVVASPHSGRHYPAELLAASRLDPLTLRRSEDAFVDRLIASAPAHGATFIAATFARAFIDLNREPFELDPAMFADVLPRHARRTSERLAAGLGAVPRVVGLGLDIYARKLTLAEAEARIERVHRPYHDRLDQAMDAAWRQHGYSVLIDCHSMPSMTPGRRDGDARRGANIILGDRNGLACHGSLTAWAKAAFEALGFTVAVNDPYAGGYTTERHGRPASGRHALQIEIDRSLYMDELAIAPHAGFGRMEQALGQFLRDLAGVVGRLPLAAAPLREAAE